LIGCSNNKNPNKQGEKRPRDLANRPKHPGDHIQDSKKKTTEKLEEGDALGRSGC